jgi:SPP1 gp7 family putative phage head morphogenesis protein
MIARPEWLDVKPKGRPQKNAYVVAAKNAPAFSRAFLILSKDLWRAVNKSMLIRAIQRHDVNGVILSFPSAADPVYQKFSREISSVYSKTIEEAGQLEWDRLKINGEFTAKAAKESLAVPMNPYSIEFMRSKSSKLVKDISEGQRNALRKTLASNFSKGRRSEVILAAIERTVGLTDIQAVAVDMRYETMIGSGAPEAIAEQGAERYGSQLLRQRAETIARTETNDAQNAGLVDSWKVAQDNGFLPKQMKKRWVALDDSDRTSDICRELDGQIVPFDEEFYSEVLGEYIDRPPGHPNCRSTLVLEFGDDE